MGLGGGSPAGAAEGEVAGKEVGCGSGVIGTESGVAARGAAAGPVAGGASCCPYGAPSGAVCSAGRACQVSHGLVGAGQGEHWLTGVGQRGSEQHPLAAANEAQSRLATSNRSKAAWGLGGAGAASSAGKGAAFRGASKSWSIAPEPKQRAYQPP